jgi:asparagine synthase (glutamine-hydrolysing)
LHYNINDGALITERYYLEPKEISTKSENQLLEEFNYLFNDSIKLRLRSDVNVGAFLSGGIDSSSVVKFMLNYTNEEKLHTYSIGFDGKYDESFFINIACESLQVKNNHHEYFKNDFFAKYEDIYMESFDEPFADYSGFSSLMVSELGKKYSTLILSGDGGDEVFGGYTIYNNAFYIDFASKLPKSLLNILLKQVRFLPKSNTSKYLKAAFELALVPKNEFISKYQSNSRFNPNILSEWSIPKLQECLNDCDNKLSESLIRFDQSFNTLPDKYLTKVDRTSMRYGVEVRSPYLDYRIVEFGNNLPLNLKVSFKNNKIFLKKFLANKLDDRILYRSKQGFTPPYVEWISNNPDKDVSSLDYVHLYSKDITMFYKQIVFKNPYDRFNKEYLIRLYLFNKWYKKWQFVN